MRDVRYIPLSPVLPASPSLRSPRVSFVRRSSAFCACLLVRRLPPWAFSDSLSRKSPPLSGFRLPCHGGVHLAERHANRVADANGRTFNGEHSLSEQHLVASQLRLDAILPQLGKPCPTLADDAPG
mmetsp:Transcript_9000/g.21626  ORF Transcript_9000/g.21626 Transcript_9000/m.21626 type:complete len:126 (-) Transcript_9000:891-1268(-)